jgi:hypothetical protein
VIRNENEIESHSLGFGEETFWQLSGECLVDELLEAVVFGKSFQDCSGDGSVIGCTGEVSASGEKGLDTAKGAKENIDEDGVAAYSPVVLFFEQPSDGLSEVMFDNLVARVKIPT